MSGRLLDLDAHRGRSQLFAGRDHWSSLALELLSSLLEGQVFVFSDRLNRLLKELHLIAVLLDLSLIELFLRPFKLAKRCLEGFTGPLGITDGRLSGQGIHACHCGIHVETCRANGLDTLGHFHFILHRLFCRRLTGSQRHSQSENRGQNAQGRHGKTQWIAIEQ